jgi:hypothetical protein
MLMLSLLMTFLQLVRALRRETSVSGDGPTTTLNQSGEMARLVEWVQLAHNSIQTQYIDWDFLWKTGSQSIASRYPVTPADLNKWDVKNIYLNSTPLGVIEYKDYIVPTSVGTAKPSFVVIMPDNSLMFDSVPDVAYTLSYDYWIRPKVLFLDSDTPIIPEQFHYAIIGDAIMRYANYESSPELFAQGKAYFDEFMHKLRNHQAGYKQLNYLKANADIEVICE